LFHIAAFAAAAAAAAAMQVRWLARLSDPWVRIVDKIIGEAVVSGHGLQEYCDLWLCCQCPGCSCCASWTNASAKQW
jgi:hypothetical protein